MKKKAKPSASSPKSKSSKEQFAKAAKYLLDISYSGAVLESEFLARGRSKEPLSAVIADAEARLQMRTWRKHLEGML